jgi:TRAP-type C4-dicarboxylate transport system permease small subunit
MKKAGRYLEKLTGVIALISFVGVVMLMLINVADVIATKVFVHSIKGAYEISELILMCTVFASFAYGQSKKTHISMTLLINRLPGKTKFIPHILGLALSAFMAGLLAWASFAEAASKLKSGSATAILHIRFYPFYYIQGICMLIFMLTLLYDMAYGIAALFNDRYGAEITKDWD